MNNLPNYSPPTQHPQIYRILGVLATLFLERAAYYGLRSIIVIWALNNLELSNYEVSGVYSISIMATYIAFIPGALLADLTKRPALISSIGLAIQALGCLTFLIPNTMFFYVGLGLFALGSGLTRPAILSMFVQLFHGSYRYLAAGFAEFMIVVNLGALSGPFLTSIGGGSPTALFFIVLAVLMLLAIVPNIINYKYLENNSFGFLNSQNTFTGIRPLFFLLIIATACLFWFTNNQLMDNISYKLPEQFFTVLFAILAYIVIGLLVFFVKIRAEINFLIGIGFMIVPTALEIFGILPIANSHYFFLPAAEVFFLVGAYTWVGQYAHPKFRALLFSGLLVSAFLPNFFMRIVHGIIGFRANDLPLLPASLVFLVILAITLFLLTFLKGPSRPSNS